MGGIKSLGRQARMKTLLSFLLILSAVGCASSSSRSPERIYAIRFQADPLDHKLREAIEQIEITASPASVYRIDKLPYDWSASVSIPLSFEVTCSLTCGHDSSAVSDVRKLSDVVFLRIATEARTDLKIKAKIWITRGSEGAGRVVALDASQIILDRQ
jgi:hypothetical protein